MDKSKKHKKIKDYIYNLTGQLIYLKDEHIDKIIEIATGPEEIYRAVFHKKNYVTNEFELIRTTKTNKERVNEVLKEYSSKASLNGFYRWDIYTPEGTLLKQIFCISSNLF